MNRTTIGIYHALTVAHSKTDSNKVHIHMSHIIYYNILESTKLMSEKSS